MAIMGTYSDLEHRLLTGAYFVSNRLDKDDVSIREISEHFDFDIKERFVRAALRSFADRGLNKARETFDDYIEQDIWLSADGLKEAERLINSGLTDVLEFDRTWRSTAMPLVDSSTWTGLPVKGVLSPSSVEKVKEALGRLESAVLASEFSNEEKAQARAYCLAIYALADAPEPPADMIWKLVMLLAALSGVGSFVTDLVGLFG